MLGLRHTNVNTQIVRF